MKNDHPINNKMGNETSVPFGFNLPPQTQVTTTRQQHNGPDWGTIESDPGFFNLTPFFCIFLFVRIGIFSLLLQKIGVKGIECQEICGLDESELDKLRLYF